MLTHVSARKSTFLALPRLRSTAYRLGPSTTHKGSTQGVTAGFDESSRNAGCQTSESSWRVALAWADRPPLLACPERVAQKRPKCR